MTLPGYALKQLVPLQLQNHVWALSFNKTRLHLHYTCVEVLEEAELSNIYYRISKVCDETDFRYLHRKNLRLDCKVCAHCAPDLFVYAKGFPESEVVTAPEFERRRCE
jgi:hypothetical protein